MNILFTNRSTRFALIMLTLLTFLGAAACGGKSKKADRAPSEQRTLQTTAPPPTGEVLKDSPCGNPDWAKPPGSKGTEPVDADFRTTNRKNSADNEPADQPGDSDDQQNEPQDAAETDD